jgi:hypothetical protein
MKLRDFLCEHAYSRENYVVKFHENEDDPGGYYEVFHGIKSIGKHPFTHISKNASIALDAAKKQLNAAYFAEQKEANDKREHQNQYEKPLSALEQEWVELDKQLVKAARSGKYEMSDRDLDRYNKLSGIIRKSLLNDTHPSMSHRK